MVFFNDPIPCEDAPIGRFGWPSPPRERVLDLASGWTRRGHDPGSVPASLRATQLSAGLDSKGASTTPLSAPSPTSPHDCVPKQSMARFLCRSACSPARRTSPLPTRWASSCPWVRPRRSRLQRHRRLEGGRGDDVIVQRDEDVTSLVEFDDAERYERFDRLQQQMSDVWAQMGRHTPGESVVVIPSVDLPWDSAGSLTQAFEERFLFLLLLLRQPQAAADLRHIHAGPACDYRVLPGIASRGHSESRLASVVDGVDRRLVGAPVEPEVARATTPVATHR